MKRKIRIAVIMILLGITLVTILQNTEVVTFRVLFWKIEASRIVILALAVVLGFVAGLVLGHGKQDSRHSPGSDTGSP